MACFEGVFALYVDVVSLSHAWRGVCCGNCVMYGVGSVEQVGSQGPGACA